MTKSPTLNELRVREILEIVEGQGWLRTQEERESAEIKAFLVANPIKTVHDLKAFTARWMAPLRLEAQRIQADDWWNVGWTDDAGFRTQYTICEKYALDDGPKIAQNAMQRYRAHVQR